MFAADSKKHPIYSTNTWRKIKAHRLIRSRLDWQGKDILSWSGSSIFHISQLWPPSSRIQFLTDWSNACTWSYQTLSDQKVGRYEVTAEVTWCCCSCHQESWEIRSKFRVCRGKDRTFCAALLWKFRCVLWLHLSASLLSTDSPRHCPQSVNFLDDCPQGVPYPWRFTYVGQLSAVAERRQSAFRYWTWETCRLLQGLVFVQLVATNSIFTSINLLENR